MARCSRFTSTPAASIACSTILREPEPTSRATKCRLLQLRQRDVFLRPDVASGHHAHHVVLHKRLHLHIPAHGRTFNQAELYAMIRQRFENGLRVAPHHRHLDLGMLRHEPRDEPGQQVLPNGLRRANCQGPAMNTSGGGHNFSRLGREFGEPFGIRQQSMPRSRECHPAPCTVEQRRLQLRFERLDLLRDRRLCQQEFLGGDAKVEMTGHSAEYAQAKILHGSRLVH